MVDGSPVRTPERAVRPKEDLDTPASVLSECIARSPARHLPQMLLATTLVAVVPLAVSLALRASGLVSGWVSVGLAVALSLGCSTAGSAYWRTRGNHGEVLFGELLLWGWIRSWRQERELANATRLLGLVNPASAQHVQPDELDVEQREQLLQQLAGGLEGQDIYLNGHSRRVARHATMIARGMGLSSEEVARIRVAAAVHDVGKLHTPKAVLNKPGRLTDAEFEVIKRHPVDGAAMVAALGDPELTRIVRHHHERLDGAGYPDRLRGDAIPVGARIIAVADTFDAITSARPYRDAAPHQKAIDILRKEAGTQLDPNAVRAFLAYYSGRRPVVVWTILTATLRRLVAWLGGDSAAAATISASKVAAATAATAVIGAAAGAAPVPVVNHAPRRVAAHTRVRPATARRRGETVGLSNAAPAVHVLTPSRAAAGRAANAPKQAAGRRRAGHDAAARRPAHAAAGKHARNRAAATRPATHATASTPGSPTTAAATGPSTVSSSGTINSSGTAGTSAAQPSPSAPASQSQGSNAGGNAVGHTKVLGNGHGKGVAAGHANPPVSPPPAPAHPPAPLPVIPAPPAHGGPGQSGPSPHGNAAGHGSNNSHGGGPVKSIVGAVPPPVAVPPPAPLPPPNPAPGDPRGQAGGPDHGHGHGHGHGG